MLKWIAPLLMVALAAGPAALAKDKKNKPVPPGQVKRQLTPSGAKPIPPGQAKKWLKGDVLPADLDWVTIDDLSKWKLDPLKPGHKYVRLDNEIYEVIDDTNTVVEAIGIVDDWIR
ncbi:hypothetical protein [Oceanomicrobium pacificus]|uniref:Nickel/cobalt transporter regulator n=1 Tax=Oceanomicrobium pacificus TaxID=2692916 RepID=A0A6B0TUH3_9RHOB|nr:hypothetical protein [Oceanomicrobium pacificus]MXU64613.1 hypothetical protein [Oceanomicrobium pacificus]